MKTLLFITALFIIEVYPAFSQDTSNFIHIPQQIAIDSKDNLYVLFNGGIARITPDGKVKILSQNSFRLIAIDSQDNIYVSGSANIKKLHIDKNDNCQFEPYAGDINYNGAGDGNLQTAKFYNIQTLAVDKNDNLYVVDKASKLISNIGPDSGRWWIEPNVPGKYKSTEHWYYVRKINNGKVSSLKNQSDQYLLFHNVTGMAIDNEGNILYSGGGMSRAIRKLDINTFKFGKVAGKPFKRDWCPVYITGDTSKAELFDPGFLILDKTGNIVFSDNRNHRITRIANDLVDTMAGNGKIDPCTQNIGGRAWEGHKDGKASNALFNFPKGMAYDSKGNLYIADSKNSCIRKLTPDGTVSSFTFFDKSKADISNH